MVAVLDTGMGEHPWLGDAFVMRDPQVLGRPIGVAGRVGRGRAARVADELVGELAPDAGHGTFIAGLVRQACPEALHPRRPDVRQRRRGRRVRPARVPPAARRCGRCSARKGTAATSRWTWCRLSLGYYHEQPGTRRSTPCCSGRSQLLGRYGVGVVVSAGNDATARPAFPAAFAPHRGGRVPDDERRIPVSAVGARNPDGTIAMFSNDGPWVKYLRPGASLVSTFPDTYDALSAGQLQGAEPTRRDAVARSTRTTSCPGSAIWSGTSFAAPVLAGEVAAALARGVQRGDARPPTRPARWRAAAGCSTSSRKAGSRR